MTLHRAAKWEVTGRTCGIGWLEMKRPPAGNLTRRAARVYSFYLVCSYNRHSMAERHSQNVPTSAAPLSIKTITNGDPTCITNASYVLREECLVRMAAYMRTCSGPEQLREMKTRKSMNAALLRRGGPNVFGRARTDQLLFR